MKNLSKILIIGIFTLFAFGIFIDQMFLEIETNVSAQTVDQPTPSKAENTSPTPPADKIKPESPKSSDKTLPKEFTLGKDSFSEYGEVAFNHDTHAFQKYSPDGKSIVGCVECHHTDQPKSDLKLPLKTSERDVALNFENWQKSTQKVTLCRACHFQDGNEPDGKKMPTAAYKIGDKETVKELNNELAYHINCNTCHDAAAALRPDLKKKQGFATTNDCMICHKEN